MKAKILFFDDIFSDLFRNKFPADQLAWDDNWVSSLTEAFKTAESSTGVNFEIVNCGEIYSWNEVIDKEKPDIILLDLFWPEQAVEKYGDRLRATDVSLEVLPKIREAFPALPVICHTAKPDNELMEKAYKKGATFFVEKVSMSLAEVQVPFVYIVINLLR